MSALLIIMLCFNQLLMSMADSPIINLCCPDVHAYKKGNKEKVLVTKHRCEEDQEPIVERGCFPHSNESQLIWKDLIWKEDEQLSKEAGTYFEFSAPPDKFKCPNMKDTVVPLDILIYSRDIRTYANGSISGHFGDGNDFVTYNSSQYCIAFTDIDYFDEKSEDVRTSYFVCHNFGDDIEETKSDFIYIFYPASIFISCFFILLTIGIYMTVQDLRNNLFGKLTLGFLFNVCIAYFFAGVHHSLYYYDPQGDMYLGTSFCVFLGYIVQHTWISFFFWTNAMAINIARKFSNILVASQEPETTGMLILNILFAQGLPLLITIVTALMDSYGDCGDILPNMGYYHCFPGNENDPFQSFATTSEFLYFYIIITVSISINIICFILTSFFLTSHWRSIQMMQTSARNSLLTHLILLTKLFFIMGIPFGFDIISKAIEKQNGGEQGNGVKITLDILNLFTGVIIFIVLCCKKTIFKKVENRIKVSPSRQNSVQSQKTQDESIYLRKFSTVSGISTVSTISNRTSEMVFSEEDEDENRAT